MSDDKPDAGGVESTAGAVSDRPSADTETLRLRDALERAVAHACPSWLSAQRSEIVRHALRQADGTRTAPDAADRWRVAYCSTLDEIRRRRAGGGERPRQPADDGVPDDSASPAPNDLDADQRPIVKALEKLSPTRQRSVQLLLYGFDLGHAARLLGEGLDTVDDRRPAETAAVRDPTACTPERRPPGQLGNAVGGPIAERACPSTDEIWAACRGARPPERIAALLDDSLGCVTCAEAWTIARELVPQAPAAGSVAAAMEATAAERGLAPAPRGRRRFRWIILAALAVTVLVMLTPRVLERVTGDGQRIRRSVETGAIRPLVEDGASLARDELILRWSPGPHGTLYAIEVETEGQDVVVRATNLPRAEYWVPVERLGDVAPGATLRWRVGAVYPDGRRVESTIQRVVVE